MPTRPQALVSPVKPVMLAMLLGSTGYSFAQTAPTAPAPAAASPAAVAAQQGLSESILRQAQGPYRMIMNSPTVVRPKPAVPTVPPATRAAEPVATSTPLSAASRKAALTEAEAGVTARSATPAPVAVAAPVNVQPPAPALSPVTPAQAATPAVNAVAVPVAMPVTAPAAAPAPLPQRAPQPAVAVVLERPLIAIRQEEPLLSGPLARERPTGVIQVGFNVNADGSTGDVSVVSSTNRKLNSAVLNAVTKWVYQPLEAVRRVDVAIEFKND